MHVTSIHAPKTGLLPAADNWTSAEMVDCILSYAVTVLVQAMTDPVNEDGRTMLARVRSNARGSKQVCLRAGRVVVDPLEPLNGLLFAPRVKMMSSL